METLVIIIMIGVLSGLLGIGLMEHLRGPTGFRRVFFGAVVLQLFAHAVFGQMNSVPFGLSLVGMVITGGLFIWYRTVLRANRYKLAMSAGALKQFTMAHFDELDTDGDGTISEVDLYRHWEGGGKDLADDQRMLLLQLHRFKWLIGHETSATPTVSPMSGTVVVLHTYGISRGDLHAWPVKAHREFEKDFGCVCKKKAR
jgi:hypothetical protein